MLKSIAIDAMKFRAVRTASTNSAKAFLIMAFRQIGIPARKVIDRIRQQRVSVLWAYPCSNESAESSEAGGAATPSASKGNGGHETLPEISRVEGTRSGSGLRQSPGHDATTPSRRPAWTFPEVFKAPGLNGSEMTGSSKRPIRPSVRVRQEPTPAHDGRRVIATAMGLIRATRPQERAPAPVLVSPMVAEGSHATLAIPALMAARSRRWCFSYFEHSMSCPLTVSMLALIMAGVGSLGMITIDLVC